MAAPQLNSPQKCGCQGLGYLLCPRGTRHSALVRRPGTSIPSIPCLSPGQFPGAVRAWWSQEGASVLLLLGGLSDQQLVGVLSTKRPERLHLPAGELSTARGAPASQATEAGEGAP